MKRPLPTLEEIKEKNITKDSLAKLLYTTFYYDINLPQDWLNNISDGNSEKYELIRSTVVWAYPPHNSMFGEPIPLCKEAEELINNYL